MHAWFVGFFFAYKKALTIHFHMHNFLNFCDKYILDRYACGSINQMVLCNVNGFIVLVAIHFLKVNPNNFKLKPKEKKNKVKFQSLTDKFEKFLKFRLGGGGVVQAILLFFSQVKILQTNKG